MIRKGIQSLTVLGAAAWLCLSPVMAGTATTRPAPPEELGGRPFSDPAAVMPMPDSWRRRGITRPTSEKVDLALAFDQQIYPALLPFVRQFAAEHNVKIAVEQGTCGLSNGAMAGKTADVGAFCCPPAITDRFPGLRYHNIGIAAVAIIVHPSNPIDSLTMDEARRLFGGAVTSWADLPMAGLKSDNADTVRVVTRLHCKLRPGDWRMLLGTDDFTAAALDVPAIADMVEQVAARPTAVGYETLWHAARYSRRNPVKTVRLDGYDPADNEALAAGNYPLYRVFSVSSWTDTPANTPLADQLVEYLKSRAGDIDPMFGIVPASRLRRAGWRFDGDELVGEPDRR